MARKTKEELEKIKKKHNCNQLWSWSRYNCYKTSPYEYFLKYVLKVKEDRKDGIYSISGNDCHDILERFYSKEIEYNQMLGEYEDSLFKFNMAELKYDRTNEDKNKLIADKYEYCLRHFFQNHNIINKKVDIERFITVKVGSQVFQGYIDFLFKEDDTFVITDWKTSSIYTGKKIHKEKGQLILYAEALRQLGVPLENIKIQWNFLKYVTVEIQQANGEFKERNIARNEIGESLSSNVKMWLKKTNRYSEDEINSFLDFMTLSNSIDNLPDDVKVKYVIKDCFVNIPYNQEEIDILKEDIINTIIEISKKEIEYKKTKDEKTFWEEVTDKQSYYFANLSGYSANLHKPYAEYIEKFEARKSGIDTNDLNKKGEILEDDLSWLNAI